MEKAAEEESLALMGRYCYELFHSSRSPFKGCPHHHFLNSQCRETVDLEMEAMGGTYIVTVTPVFDEKGDLTNTIHIAKDITERTKKEKQLLSINRALRTLSECNQAMIRAKNEKELISELCKILVEIGGYRMAWVGYAMDDENKSVRPAGHYGFEEGYLKDLNITWSDNEKGLGPTGTAICTGKPGICRNIQRDIRFKPWQKEAIRRGYASSIALPLNSADRCIGALNIYSDKPDAFDDNEIKLLMELADDLNYGIMALRSRDLQKRAEKALAASENKYRMLIETASDAIFLADAETGIILEANKAAEKLLGLPVNKIIGMHQTELHDPEKREHYLKIFKHHVKSETAVTDDIYVRNSKGFDVPVQINTNIFTLENRKVIQGIFRDITEIKNAEEQIRQSQKMEAIGTLAGGIAHDFNNILTPILGYTKLSLDKLPDNSPVRSYLEKVWSAGIRAKELVKQILTFSRKEKEEKRPFLIQDIINESIKFFRSSIPSTIKLHTKIDKQCGPVMCNPTQIYQVLMNLCSNAHHAMLQKGGTLNIELKSAAGKPGSSLSVNSAQPEKYICLTVSDTGKGMDKDIIQRIFEPYFTTKTKEDGTGLGLSVVHGIIKNHGGYIEVESEPNGGTAFKIYLPEIEYSLEPEDEVSAQPVRKGSEQILLIDDDRNVLEITEEILRSLGYKVVSISNSIDALKVFSADPEKFDLIITDQTMPDIPGIELSKKILQIKPDIPIILCRGYDSAASKEKAISIGIADYLTKPVSKDEFALSIKKTLREKKQPEGQ